MFATLAGAVASDPDYPARVHDLDVRSRVLNGTIYDTLPHQFHEDKTPGGEYVPLSRRTPSVRYNLCRMVVQDSIALLFGEGRFPAVDSKDDATKAVLAEIADESKLSQVMLEAALRGSVGTAVLRMRVLLGRVFFDTLDPRYLTPAYDPLAPDTLVSVTERYKVRGDVLAGQGYAIKQDDLQAWFWFQRVWDAQEETWFLPWKVSDRDAVPQPDKAHTVRHGLGFVPLAWIKNLPGGEGIDGACTFAPAVDTSIEIDYQLSQAGRGLKYSSDPLLLLKEPATDSDGEMVRSAAQAIQVSEKGDAKLLEINGTAAGAVIEYVRFLRELAIESIHGNRSSADKISAAQSGRALELMHQPLIWLADQLRVSYGDNGLLPLMVMVAKASHVHRLLVRGKPVTPIRHDGLSLRWQPWFQPTDNDKMALAQTLQVLRNAGLLSREAGVTLAETITNQPDVALEVARILADEAAAREAAADLPAAQSRLTENLPA